jgi:hypothetical protein
MNEEETSGIIPPDQKDIDEANTSSEPSFLGRLGRSMVKSRWLKAVGMGAGITAGISAMPNEAHGQVAIVQPAPERPPSVVNPIFSPRTTLETRKQEDQDINEFIIIDLNDPRVDLSQPVEYTAANKKILIKLDKDRFKQGKAGILTSPTTFAESMSLYEYNCKFLSPEDNQARLANMTPEQIEQERRELVIYPGKNVWKDEVIFQVTLVNPDDLDNTQHSPIRITISVKYPQGV